MSRTRDIMGGPKERAAYGCTVSFENDAGRTLVLHRLGKPTVALVECLGEALALDRSFRVVAYSTPQTIYADMSGGRDEFASMKPLSATLSDAHQFQKTQTVEAGALGRIGCVSMLHPRLAGQSRQAAARKQAKRDPLEAVQAARELIR